MHLAQQSDVAVLGAGVSGIYQIKRLTDLGLDAVLFEGEDDLGGTWYRNRYPGCRFDSESYTYGYSFSKELLDEWHWKERFSSQPENLQAICNYVADKFDLRRHMRFNAYVSRAWTWDESTLPNGTLRLRGWRVAYRARFVVTGLGTLLGSPTLPNIRGQGQTLRDESFHSYLVAERSPSNSKASRVGM